MKLTHNAPKFRKNKMITKVTYQEEPTLFENIVEFSIEDLMEHRRGSNFYREDIIEFTAKNKEYFPDIENFEQYIGTWRTDNIIWDDNNGFDGDSYSQLTRVEKKEIVSYEWVNV